MLNKSEKWKSKYKNREEELWLKKNNLTERWGKCKKKTKNLENKCKMMRIMLKE